MKKAAVIFTTCYFLRSAMFLFLGYYHYFIQSVFWRFELYFIISTLFEVPNLVMIYVTNYNEFQSI